jgi:hypothetical protein
LGRGPTGFDELLRSDCWFARVAVMRMQLSPASPYQSDPEEVVVR